jgi:hypothetical protein
MPPYLKHIRHHDINLMSYKSLKQIVVLAEYFLYALLRANQPKSLVIQYMLI